MVSPPAPSFAFVGAVNVVGDGFGGFYAEAFASIELCFRGFAVQSIPEFAINADKHYTWYRGIWSDLCVKSWM